MASEGPAHGTTRVATGAELHLEGAWEAVGPTLGGRSTTEPDATAELELEGEFVRWVGAAGPNGGQAEVAILRPDGSHVDEPRLVDLHADREHAGQILFARYDLPPARYRLRIRARGAPRVGERVTVERLEWGRAVHGTRYIDGREGSAGDDSAPGTSPEAAWRTFAPLRGATLAPGCSIRLARGSTWSEMLGPLHGSGRDDAPIVIGPYGEGRRPHIRLSGAPSDRAAWLADPDRLTIGGLEVSGAGAGIVAYYTTNGHRGLRFEDIHTHDNDAIHWHDSREWVPQPDLPGMYHGAAILITGRVPVTADEAAVQDVRFERIRSERDSDPIDISGFNPRLGNLEFLGTSLGTHAVRGIRMRDCELRDGKGGCNFDNVEDMTMVSTLISGMCRVPQIIGTTGLFFWSVDRVDIVNSVFSDLPDTGSVDGTGCDLEAYTRRVRFMGSFFARNAASGIEYLAIEVGGRPTRPGDHCVEHEVIGCGFSDNVRKDRPERPSEQLGSIHLRSDTDVPFSGRTSGNLYAERFPFIHVSGDRAVPGWRSEGDLPVAGGELTSAADAFGPGAVGAAGAGWRHERVDKEDRRELRWDEAAGAWVDDELVVSRFETRLPSRPGVWAARTWIAPRAGTIAIRGFVCAAADAAERLAARITRNGDVLLTLPDRASISVGELTGWSTDLDQVAVGEGDALGFEVSLRDGDGPGSAATSGPGPTVSWSPLVAYVADAASAR